MIKKCIGCGLELQTEDKTKLGYTPDIKNVYCMRCFRLKNYGEKKESEFVNEEEIILKVNRSKGVIFFLIDYLNLNKYTLNIFKSLNLPKVLVISKADTLRRDMKFNKIKRWLSSVYNIGEDIIFMSNKNDFKNFNIFKYMDKLNIRNCYIMGITNAGKSTYINSLLKNNHIKKEIITSNKPNTTLDFIKIRINDYVIYDTPGFDYLNLNSKIIEKEIKPLTYSLKGDTTIVINNIYELYFKEHKIDTDVKLTDYEVYLEGDYNRLFQVLTNIMKNSIEALGNDPKIKVWTEINDDKFYIYIKDNGEGIPKDILEKIREPFFTTKMNGTGLGVSLSNEIIESHNGKLLYESEMGDYTLVTIVLPILEWE